MNHRYPSHEHFMLAALVSACVCTAAPARADYQPNKYVEPGTNLVLEYNLFVPDGVVAGTKYPLLVYLHAANNEATPHRTLSSDGKGWVPQIMSADRAKTKAFYMIPISQTNASGWGDPVGPISDPQKFEGRLTVVVLKQLLDKYPIDPDRLYVTGASMGARGTYDLLRRYPDLFAAGAPCAAPANPADAAIYATQNIWSAIGSNDPVVQPNRDTIAATRKACGNPIYTELAGHGHDAWRSIYPMPEFAAWMFAQRRGVPWPQVSSAPTPAQILAAEQPPVNGLSPSQPLVSTPTNCTTAGGGTTGAGGGSSNGGAPSAGSSSTGGVPSVAGSSGVHGGAGGSDAATSGGQGGLASGVAGQSNPGAGGAPRGEGGASNGGALPLGGSTLALAGAGASDDSQSDPDSGCSLASVGRSSAPRLPASVIALIGALAVLGVRRRRHRSACDGRR